jgi:acetoin utilization deacetylase AcuC-like enzyme
MGVRWAFVFSTAWLSARGALDEHGLARVMIVDWDVHHGNGTQEMFWDDGRVGFLSIHCWPFYPGTGAADETGSGRGLGWIANAPVALAHNEKIFTGNLNAPCTRWPPK